LVAIRYFIFSGQVASKRKCGVTWSSRNGPSESCKPCVSNERLLRHGEYDHFKSVRQLASLWV
jgi:hypothetical protein